MPPAMGATGRVVSLWWSGLGDRSVELVSLAVGAAASLVLLGGDVEEKGVDKDEKLNVADRLV